MSNVNVGGVSTTISVQSAGIAKVLQEIDQLEYKLGTLGAGSIAAFLRLEMEGQVFRGHYRHQEGDL